MVQAAQVFSNTISAGIPGTSFSATSVNVQYQGQTASEETTESSQMMVVIIAVVVGITLIAIVGAVIIVVKWRYRSVSPGESEVEEQGSCDDDKNI